MLTHTCGESRAFGYLAETQRYLAELCANVEVCRERGSPEEGQVPRRNTRQAELATQGERGGWCTRERHHDVNALVCGDRCVEIGVSDAS